MNKFIKLLCLGALLIGSNSLAMDSDQNGLPAILSSEALAQVETLKSDGRDVDPSTRGDDLCTAAISGDLELINKLLSAKVPADAKRSYISITPLSYAAIFNQKKACIMLIHAKAEINATDSNGVTPLMNAAISGNKDICQLLLDANAQINTKSNDGRTVLRYAANQKNIYLLFVDYIISSIKQKRTAAIAFIGMKKFNRASSMRSNNKDEIQMIARQVFNPNEITKLLAEIDSIENNEMREFIRAYALKGLKE